MILLDLCSRFFKNNNKPDEAVFSFFAALFTTLSVGGFIGFLRSLPTSTMPTLTLIDFLPMMIAILVVSVVPNLIVALLVDRATFTRNEESYLLGVVIGGGVSSLLLISSIVFFPVDILLELLVAVFILGEVMYWSYKDKPPKGYEKLKWVAKQPFVLWQKAKAFIEAGIIVLTLDALRRLFGIIDFKALEKFLFEAVGVLVWVTVVALVIGVWLYLNGLKYDKKKKRGR